MRLARIKVQGRRVVYHCISRIVGGQALLDDLGKEKLVGLMGRLAAFCGMEVITYCILSNHLHILVRVGEPGVLGEEELVRRMEALYGKRGLWVKVAREGIRQTGRVPEDVRRGMEGRMGDVSVFMKELKQRYSRWYNRRGGRYGTLWAERFKSVVVEDQPGAVEAVAAYIDLNPVRAGLVEDPAEYRFSGYGEAVGGGQRARAGILSFQGGVGWEEGGAAYRRRLYAGGGESGASGKRVMDREQIQAVMARGGELSWGQVLRLRIRHMSDGVVLGSKGFVNEIYAMHREKFGSRRRDGARPIRGVRLGGLMALRDLRVKAVT